VDVLVTVPVMALQFELQLLTVVVTFGLTLLVQVKVVPATVPVIGIFKVVPEQVGGGAVAKATGVGFTVTGILDTQPPAEDCKLYVYVMGALVVLGAGGDTTTDGFWNTFR